MAEGLHLQVALMRSLDLGGLKERGSDVNSNCELGKARWLEKAMAKQARTRIYGNDAIDGMPELVQEWYHAVGTPMGVGNMAWAKECRSAFLCSAGTLHLEA